MNDMLRYKTATDGECFAHKDVPDKEGRRCKVLEDPSEMMSRCNTYMCPFYKPKGLEHLSRVDADKDHIKLISKRQLEQSHKPKTKYRCWRITSTTIYERE